MLTVSIIRLAIKNTKKMEENHCSSREREREGEGGSERGKGENEREEEKKKLNGEEI